VVVLVVGSCGFFFGGRFFRVHGCHVCGDGDDAFFWWPCDLVRFYDLGYDLSRVVGFLWTEVWSGSG